MTACRRPGRWRVYLGASFAAVVLLAAPAAARDGRVEAPAVVSARGGIGATTDILFNERVRADRSSFTLRCASDHVLRFTLSPSPATRYTLTPAAAAAPGTACAVEVRGAGVQSASGRRMVGNRSYRFRVPVPFVPPTPPS